MNRDSFTPAPNAPPFKATPDRVSWNPRWKEGTVSRISANGKSLALVPSDEVPVRIG